MEVNLLSFFVHFLPGRGDFLRELSESRPGILLLDKGLLRAEEHCVHRPQINIINNLEPMNPYDIKSSSTVNHLTCTFSASFSSYKVTDFRRRLLNIKKRKRNEKRKEKVKEKRTDVF